MAPKQKHVFVVFDVNFDGNVEFAEVCSKEENAHAVVEKLKGEGKVDARFSKVELDVTQPAKKGGKAASTAKKGKAKSDSTVEDEDEEGDGDETPAKPKKTLKKAAKTEDEDGDDPKSARKTVPDGVLGSLEGLTLIFTGTMETDRATTETTAEKYGATITKKLHEADYVIVGTKPGPKKLVEIEEKGIKTMTEKEFLQMIKDGAEPPKKKLKT